MASIYVVLECQGLIHLGLAGCGKRRLVGGCGKTYKAHKQAFHKRLNACPVCGSSKAKWQGPTRQRPEEQE